MSLHPLIIVGIIIFAFGCAAAICFRSPKFKGKFGEHLVNQALDAPTFEKRYTVSDLTFISEDKSVQIDHILINRHGLFVIETKNYVQSQISLLVTDIMDDKI